MLDTIVSFPQPEKLHYSTVRFQWDGKEAGKKDITQHLEIISNLVDWREELEVKFRNSGTKSQSLNEDSRFCPVVSGSLLKILSRK